MRRRLSRDEAQVWARLVKTVTPFDPPRHGGAAGVALGPQRDRREAGVKGYAQVIPPPKARDNPPVPLHQPAAGPPSRFGEERKRPLDRHGLDGSWDKKLAHGMVAPDFTLDLHGHSLDSAYARLDHGLSQASAMGARVVLVITGRPRPVEAADRAGRRGAIRAKLLDWLAAGPYSSSIAAVRAAHRRHGGAGAVYVVLRRRG